MRIKEHCFDCLLSRVEYESRLATDDEKLVARVLAACTGLLRQIREEPVPAPVIASRVHRLAYGILGNPDPYYHLKQENNRVARIVADLVQDRLLSFRELSLAAVISNTLDYGSGEHIVTEDFRDFFFSEFEKGFTIDHTVEIESLADRVLYLCDNCGEIVFDTLLMRYLKSRGSHITVVVKGAPILNDATCEDARQQNIGSFVDHVIPNSNGIAELGLNLDIAPPELKTALRTCSLIIAKGMANYESLSEYTGLPPVAYLTAVKCRPIAESIGVPNGSRIALLSR